MLKVLVEKITLRSKMESNFKLKIGIIGGTGLNKVDILKDSYEVEVDTVFGKPSDKLLCGKINNVDCVLLSRHGKYTLK